MVIRRPALFTQTLQSYFAAVRDRSLPTPPSNPTPRHPWNATLALRIYRNCLCSNKTCSIFIWPATSTFQQIPARERMSHVDFGRYSKRLVQMIWDPEPRNDDAEHPPIWCLGRQYEARFAAVPGASPLDVSSLPSSPQAKVDVSLNAKANPPLSSRITSSGFEHVVKDDLAIAINGAGEEWPIDFLDDFESRIWLTYRSNFPPIPRSKDPKASSAMSLSVRLKNQLSNREGFTSDTGWGCMIRSGQSLLANTLALLHLGRDHRRGSQEMEERRLISLFADDARAPFSIHKFVEHGAVACGTYPGQWFGPSATAKCIQALCNTHADSGLKVYVTGDGPDVFEDTLYSIAKGSDGQFTPTLLLVGTRLGIDRVTPVYRDALRASLMMPQAVGVAGGRPSSSHYFVGTQGKNFFYLDPHLTRPALPFYAASGDYTADELDSCHTRRLRCLPIEEMDPSMLIGFLFRNEGEWKSWRQRVSEAPGKHIFHVENSEPGLGQSTERDEALDEVETLDDDHDLADETHDGADS